KTEIIKVGNIILISRNKPTGFISSGDESGKEQTSKVLELNIKLQDTSSSLFIKDSRNKPTGFVSSGDESGKEQTSKVPELSAKLQNTSSSLFIKDSRNKPTGFVSSDDESASNKSIEVVSSNDENDVGHQPKKNSKNSKKKSKSKKSKKQRKRKQSTSRSDSRSNSSSERTSRLEIDSSPAAPRKVTYHSLTELPKDTKDNLHHHRHQREDLLKKEKSESERTEEIKIKHGNSRRSEKQIRQTNMVRHLQLLDNPIVSKLKKSELNPIILENAYHSLEESEVDSDNDSNENRIIIRDIKWRSNCLRMFLRDYLDYAPGEETAPLNASRWTRSGYKGSMLSIITEELKKYRENDDGDDIGHHSRKKPKSNILD
ncbi:hypothetical protein C1646_774599, partial [Rhizophagus diaphanus]